MTYKRILLDAGHGPNNTHDGALDSGATFGPLTEYGFVSGVVEEVVRYFANKPLSVIRTPEIRLDKLVSWCNAQYEEGDAIVAVHLNAGPLLATGTEVVISSTAPGWRKGEATVLGSAVAQRLGIRFRGVVKDTDTPRGRLAVLRDTKAPAFILEMGFITNVNDVDRLKTHGVGALIEGIWELVGRGGE